MKQRLVTGIISGFIFLLLLFLGNYAYLFMIMLLSLIAYKEYINMNNLRLVRFSSWVGLILTLLITFPWDKFFFSLEINSSILVYLFFVLLLFSTVISRNKISIDEISLNIAGAIYISVGFHYMIEMRMIEHHGLFWSLLIFLCIWATDSAAYFAGIRFGKHKLWPEISPKKSIEGAIAGVIFSIVVALIFSFVNSELLPIQQAIIIGFLASLLAQFGDLIESAIKRKRGVKDSGNLFPGHGGVLDRVDSWLIVFPCIYFYIHNVILVTS